MEAGLFQLPGRPESHDARLLRLNSGLLWPPLILADCLSRYGIIPFTTTITLEARSVRAAPTASCVGPWSSAKGSGSLASSGVPVESMGLGGFWIAVKELHLNSDKMDI